MHKVGSEHVKGRFKLCVCVTGVETNLLMACHDAIQSLRHGLGVRAFPLSELFSK